MTMTDPPLWTAIAPGPRTTRVLATSATEGPLLKAHLRSDPAHPRALPTLLEALALWQGATVHAVLVADARSASYAPSLYHAAFPAADGAPLFTLTVAEGPAPRGRNRLGAMGAFDDLRHALTRAGRR